MMEKTFKKMDEFFRTMEREMDTWFKSVQSAPIGKTFDNDGFFDNKSLWTSTVLTTPRPKYEYRVIEVHIMAKENNDIEAYLNKLGEDGWEMIQNDGGRAIFMREKAVEEEVEDE
jgi:hypothetical protein